MLSIITGFYILNSKFTINKYIKWIKYFLDNITSNIVIFTDKKTFNLFNDCTYKKPNIKILIYELHEFYNYKYIDYWKKNHKGNHSLNTFTGWELNMLWSEKISFINKAIELGYINTEWCCWCDIGYFRNEERGTLKPEELRKWPSNNKIKNLNKEKIYYGMSHNNSDYLNELKKICLKENNIPFKQCSIAGGFFLIHKEKVKWWLNTYDNILKSYFENNRLVKDDQIIIVNAYSLFTEHFNIIYENNNNYNHWFLFQRWLLN
jgi:hypothetical protein